MSKYKLDDLMDWGRALTELEELRKEGLLDEHQDGLRRIIRYKRNWQLRTCALECAREVRLPQDELIQELCSVVCDEDSYPELRMRAAEVMADLVLKRNGKGEKCPLFKGVPIHQIMKRLLDVPLNPFLAQTLQTTLTKIEEDDHG